VLAGELLDKLRSLGAAHNGLNNFYNEWPHAESLALSLPVTGVVPRAARLEWVKTIAKCHIGNGHGFRDGVDSAADRHYQAYIEGFGQAEVVEFLKLFEDSGFTVDFGEPKADARVRALAVMLREKTKNIHIRRAIDALLAQPKGTLRKLSIVTEFKEALKNLPKSN
jgi:hypothetical protein